MKNAMNGTMQRELVALIEVALFNFVDKVYQTILFSPYRFRKKGEGGRGGGKKKNTVYRNFQTASLLLQCRCCCCCSLLNTASIPCGVYTARTVLNILGREGIFGEGKKQKKGKKKERGGEKRRKNGGGKNRGTRHSRAAVHCAARLKRNCRKTVREYSLFHVNKFNSLRPIKNRRADVLSSNDFTSCRYTVLIYIIFISEFY